MENPTARSDMRLPCVLPWRRRPATLQHMEQVEHDAGAERFVLRLGGSPEAILEYRRSGKILDFVHTFVPPAFRGRGLAQKVLRAAVSSARANRLRVIPSCPSLATYLL